MILRSTQKSLINWKQKHIADFNRPINATNCILENNFTISLSSLSSPNSAATKTR